MNSSVTLTMRQFYYILSNMHSAKKAEQKGREEIQKIAKKRLKKLVRYAKGNSPFYARYYKDIDPDNFELQDLPPITKEILMKNFDDIVTDQSLKLNEIEKYIAKEKSVEEFYQNKYKIFKTSGSSGQGGILVYSLPELWKSTAYEISRGVAKNIIKELPKILFRGFVRKPLNIAVLAVIGPHHATASSMYSLIPQFFMPIKGFDVNLKDADIISQLNDYDPFVILSYPTKLEMLAHDQLEGKLSIHPKYIKTVGEVLTPSAKKVIDRAFGVETSDTYGCSEANVMAGECGSGNGLHIHEDVCLVEAVDIKGNAVGDGELSNKVYVTNLLKYTQPVIRYELEDVISVNSEPCTCGSSMSRINAIYGRNFDMLWAKKNDGSYAHIHPQGIDAGITLVKGVKNYQVIQEELNKLNVKIMLKESANKKSTLSHVKSSLIQTLSETGVEKFVKININMVNNINRDPKSKKIRRIISRVEAPVI